MKRVAAITVSGVLCLLAACGGGGGTTTPTTGGPLKIVFAAASPSEGGSPLRATLTANISGGQAPYYYAWDYSSDGSYDEYFNNIFLKTLSVQHDFYLTSTDGTTSTVYQALLRVTDSLGNSVTSKPVAVTVTPGNNLQIPDIRVYSGTQGTNGAYILKSGEPVFFQPTVTGGTGPYTYQWDFDSSGSVDSTLTNPQYTYTYSGTATKNFVARLRVVDALGNATQKDVIVAGVVGSGNTDTNPGGTGAPGFTIVLNSNPPADASGVITLNFDQSASTPGLPLEPKLDLSVVVDASQGGRPPFEYYWDFENDGSFDSQVVAPTIPYYDPQRKIQVNPYLSSERSKVYTLRVLVIDSFGQIQEATRTIVANNVENSAGTLNVTAPYGVAVGGVFKDTPPQPYGQVAKPNDETDILFTVVPTGGTGKYDWQLDINGDGVADWPDIVTDVTGFHPILNATTDSKVVIPFGQHDDPLNPGSKIAEWPALGYYAATATVRSLDDQGQPKQTFKVQVPVSLVRRDPVTIAGGGLISRRAVMIGGVSAAATASPNGNYVPSRTVVIAGGYTGTTPLRDVQQITQTFTAPTLAGKLETVDSTTVAGKLPMNQARAFGAGGTDGANFFAVGGENIDNGIIGLTEDQPLLTNSGWAVGGNLNIPQYYPLTQAGSTFMPVTVGTHGPGLYFAGGLHPPGGSDVDSVSGTLIYSDLTDKDGNATNGIQMGFGSIGSGMVTERYDTCMAFANQRLYVIGGRVASGRSVATVEAFNLNNGQWENAPSLLPDGALVGRSGASCQVLKDSNDHDIIYVIGGGYYPSSSGDKTVLGSAQAFNTKTGVWSWTVGLPANQGTDNGATVALAGPGSAVTIPALTNQIWYFGGALAGGGDTSALYEFTYFYTFEVQ